MTGPIEPTKFAKMGRKLPVIDVRSPGEYRQGHITGAFNIPLFDDAERAAVGTLYTRQGKDKAIIKGLELAIPRTKEYVTQLHKVVPGREILIHCWRGGMRSASMAGLFSQAGYQVHVLEGGYKAWRRMVRATLSAPAAVVVLGGPTGSGKTVFLKELALLGEQVIDLEALAAHKGSVFGHLGQQSQPTNEQFENDLFHRWQHLDPLRRIWLEDESRMIGKVTLPDPLYQKIATSPLIRLIVDHDERIRRLVDEYAGFDKGLLSEALHRLNLRLGGSRLNEALVALENNRFDRVAAIVLAYYDKAYQFSLDRRPEQKIHSLRLSGGNLKEQGALILEFTKKREKDEAGLS